MNPENLTLKNCESYLYDEEVYKRNFGRSLVELFVNSSELLPKNPHPHLALYKVEEGKLIYIGISPIGFSRKVKKLNIDVKDCFVLLLENKKEEQTHYLISLKADFLSWNEAIIVRKDIETKELEIDFVSNSKDSNFMSDTYFKRFFTHFPLFLLENGVKAAYPILATKKIKGVQ